MTSLGERVLALIRHGESTWLAERRFQGGADPPLSARGERQARALARRMAAPDRAPVLPLPIDPPVGLWHSPLRRAASTAEAIIDAYPVAITRHRTSSLVELGQGAWEGLTHDEVATRHAGDLAAWRRDPVRHAPTGGEPLPHGQERARELLRTVLLPALDDAAAAVAGQAPRDDAGVSEPTWGVIVAHEGILRLVLLEALGLPLDAYWAFPFSLASVSVLERRAGTWRLRAHNLDEHLAEAG